MKTLIIYRIDKNDLSNHGVVSKMNGQIKALYGLGHDVDYVVNVGPNIFMNQTCIYTAPFLQTLLSFKFFWFKHITKTVLAQQYDLIFIRYGLSTPYFHSFLKKIKLKYPSTKIVIDLPTYPYHQEWTGFFGQLVLLIDRVYKKHLYKYVTAITHSGEDKTIFGIPVVKLSNGIDIDTFPKRIIPPFSQPFNMVAVGKWRFWHGLDRLLYGIAAYHGKEQLRLYIVGEGPELASLKTLVSKLNLDSSVQFCGALVGSDLDNIFGICHVAIGTLGLHRKEVSINSSLKHREYCARNIPFILSSSDSDFDDSLAFVKYFSSTDEHIAINDVLSFYVTAIKDLQLQNKMTLHAQNRLSWTPRMKHLIEKVCLQ
jgi:hypothetical protein